MTANIPYQASIGTVFALSFVNKDTTLHYHDLLRESVSEVIGYALENAPKSIARFMQTQAFMYNCIPHIYEAYFGNSDAIEIYVVGITPDEL